MKNFYKIAGLSFLLMFSLARAGTWHPVYESGNSYSITALASAPYDFRTQVGTGDQGDFYRSFDGGNYWEVLNPGTSDHLNDVIVFDTGNSLVTIVAGDNGTVLRSEDFGNTWEPVTVDSAGLSDNLHALAYDQSNGLVWVGGENGAMYNSADYGRTWKFVPLENKDLAIVDMVWDYDGLFMVGVKNDTSFVHKIQDIGSAPYVLFAKGDTIPNIKIRSAYYSSGNLFLAGNNTLSGDAEIYSRFYSNNLGPHALVNLFPQINITDMAIFNNAEPTISIIWFTTDQGEIWESRDNGNSFIIVYKDPLNRSINTIMTNINGISDIGLGVAAGLNELIVKYSFELINLHPNRNDNISYPTNNLEMLFSSPADLTSIKNSVKITSNLSGNVPYSAEYDPADSNRVFLNINRTSPPESVPGEKWNIIVGDSIKQNKDDGIPSFFNGFSYDVNFEPYGQGTMDFKSSTLQDIFKKPTTNFVTGFFNNNDVFDLATFDGDTLFVIEMNDAGMITNLWRFGFNLGRSVDAAIKDQLILADLNNDGRQDIIFYDSGYITSFINQSTDQANFVPSGVVYNSTNIKQVLIYFADRNNLPDMMILNDSLLTRMDISDTGFGWQGSIVEFGGAMEQRIKIADIDVDGWPDIISANTNGSISYYHGLGEAYFDIPVSYSSGTPYRDVFLADLNQDKRLDIIALKDYDFDVYSVDQADNRGLLLQSVSPVQQGAPSYIEDMDVNDFGGQLSQFEDPAQMDIAILTSDSTLKFFENVTMTDGNTSFSERTDKQLKLSYAPNGLIDWDGNRDANLDLFTFDHYSGMFQDVVNSSWSPFITDVHVEAQGVRVNWRRFTNAAGDFEYYRIYKESWDHGFQNVQSTDFLNVDDTTWLDTETRPLEHYEYRIEVGYGGQVSAQPFPVSIDLVTYINGPISGTLNDTISGYVVDNEINVPPGQSLIIDKGVRIGFSPGAVFNVFGSLDVNGTPYQMIEFTPFYRDSTFSRDSIYNSWHGIRLHPGADTVSFNWFSVGGADSAIVAQNRPFEMRIGGISRNNYGIVSIGDTLTLENVVLDSNQVGIVLDNNKSTLKNIDVISNQTGIDVLQKSSVNVRNAIIWYNSVTGVNVNAGALFKISYSTLDMINGPFSSFELNRYIDPVFITVDRDTGIIYQPDPLSPTVDAGDPNDDFSLEPMPNGGRINQGLLGGLQLATRSIRPKLVVQPDPILPRAKIGEIDTTYIQISNEGVIDLNVSVIDIGALKDVFSFTQPGTFTLTAGQTTQYALLFKPQLRQQYIDTLLITSTDPNYPVYKTPIMAVGENSLPELVENPQSSARVGQKYTFQIQTRDQDNDNVTVSITQRPSWLLQGTGNTFNGTPAATDIGVDTLAFILRDSFGGTRAYSFPIIVFQDNMLPQFVPVPDTTIYTNVQFYFHWKVSDADGDSLKFSDNSSLFNIQADSGIIAFTPQISDTGTYHIVLSVSDGKEVVQDTFNLEIKLNFLNAAQNLELTPLDQAINVAFTMPSNNLYTATQIRLSSSQAVISPNQGLLVKDTVLTAGTNVQYRIGGLKINTPYSVSVFNYYLAKESIFSQPVYKNVTTLAPKAELSDSDVKIDLPVNQVDKKEIMLKNNGGGTLIARFNYDPDSLLNVWFDMDTSEHKVAPFDSVYISYELHPNKYLPRGMKKADFILESNDPGTAGNIYAITMNPIFDDFNPNIVITAKPDSLVRQAAFSIHFYGDDTTGYLIGDPQDSLYYFYRLFKGLQNPRLIESGDSIRNNSLTFYPLDDGFYTLRIWALDTEGNQKSPVERKNIPFYVEATTKRILKKNWQMLSIPRPVKVVWSNYVVDSLLQIYRWDNNKDSYLPIHSFINETHNMGEAVWIISSYGFPINVSKLSQASVDSSYSTPVVKGWNQLGTPIGYVTGWGNMTFTPLNGQQMSLAEAVQKNLVSPVVYWYDHTAEDYSWQDIAEAVAEPWRGYWLKADVDGSLRFSTLAVDTLTNNKNTGSLLKISSDLKYNISLKTNENRDRQNVFGIADTRLVKDVQEPPQIGSYSTFYFSENNNRLSRKIYDPFSSADDVKTWEAVVETYSGHIKHTLTWNTKKMASSGLFFFMVDMQKETLIDMNKEGSYSFIPAVGKVNFKIYASQDESFRPKIIPSAFRLIQNYPNPFNPTTTIRFGVPANMENKNIRIIIYNVLGQEITELFNKNFKAGFHEVKWNGQNNYGQRVSSGIYFYKLITGSTALTRKMILLR